LFTRSAILQKIDSLHEDRPSWNGIPEAIEVLVRLKPNGRLRAYRLPAVIQQTKTRPGWLQRNSGFCQTQGGNVIRQYLVASGIKGRGSGGFPGSTLSEKQRGLSIDRDSARVENQVTALAEKISHEPAHQQSPHGSHFGIRKEIRYNFAAAADLKSSNIARKGFLPVEGSKRSRSADASEANSHLRLSIPLAEAGQFQLRADLNRKPGVQVHSTSIRMLKSDSPLLARAFRKS
jgi:hypothetical protein